MHELSIAMNIIDIAEENLDNSDATRLIEIEIEIGELSGVIPEALEFAMKNAVSNTVLENANVRIEIIKGMAKCRKCSNEFEMTQSYDPCPKCSEYNCEIITGKELRVKSILVE